MEANQGGRNEGLSEDDAANTEHNAVAVSIPSANHYCNNHRSQGMGPESSIEYRQLDETDDMSPQSTDGELAHLVSWRSISSLIRDNTRWGRSGFLLPTLLLKLHGLFMENCSVQARCVFCRPMCHAMFHSYRDTKFQHEENATTPLNFDHVLFPAW